MIEAVRQMVRICRIVEIVRVAIVTHGRQPVVHVVHVAIAARNGLMGSGQWERRVVVTEYRRQPRCGCVTWDAVMTEVA
jgi:hypothetical protein